MFYTGLEVYVTQYGEVHFSLGIINDPTLVACRNIIFLNVKYSIHDVQGPNLENVSNFTY